MFRRRHPEAWALINKMGLRVRRRGGLYMIDDVMVLSRQGEPRMAPYRRARQIADARAAGKTKRQRYRELVEAVTMTPWADLVVTPACDSLRFQRCSRGGWRVEATYRGEHGFRTVTTIEGPSRCAVIEELAGWVAALPTRPSLHVIEGGIHERP